MYPDPQWRPYVDVDVLVPGERIGEAIAVLADLGYQRQSPELRRGFDQRFGKGTTLRKAAAATVDLHRTLIAGPYSFLIDADSLFVQPRSFQCAQDSLRTLNAEAQLVHCAVSADARRQPAKAHRVARPGPVPRGSRVGSRPGGSSGAGVADQRRCRLRRRRRRPSSRDLLVGTSRWTIRRWVQITSGARGVLGIQGARTPMAASDDRRHTVRVWVGRPDRVHTISSRCSRKEVGLTSDRIAEHDRRTAGCDAPAPFFEPTDVPAEHHASEKCEPKLVHRAHIVHLRSIGPSSVYLLQAHNIENVSTRRMITHLLELRGEPLSLSRHPVQPVGQLGTKFSTLDDFRWENVRHGPPADGSRDPLTPPPPLRLLNGEFVQPPIRGRIAEFDSESLGVGRIGLRLCATCEVQPGEVASPSGPVRLGDLGEYLVEIDRLQTLGTDRRSGQPLRDPHRRLFDSSANPETKPAAAATSPDLEATGKQIGRSSTARLGPRSTTSRSLPRRANSASQSGPSALNP